MRQVTFYQVTNSDIRSVGVAQAAATFFAAIGTFALSLYLEFSKDVSIAEANQKQASDFMVNVADVFFWAWVVFWGIAFIALLWQGNELMRIKEEHGERTLRSIVRGWFGYGAR